MIKNYRKTSRKLDNVDLFLSNESNEGLFCLKEEHKFIRSFIDSNELRFDQFNDFWNQHVLEEYLLINWPSFSEEDLERLKNEYYTRIFVPLFSEREIAMILIQSGEFEEIEPVNENVDQVYKIDLIFKDRKTNEIIILQVKSGQIRKGKISEELISQHKSGFETSCVYIEYCPQVHGFPKIKVLSLFNTVGEEFNQWEDKKIIECIRKIAKRNKDFYQEQKKQFPLAYAQNV